MCVYIPDLCVMCAQAVLGHPLEGEDYEEGCLCGDADCGDEL